MINKAMEKQLTEERRHRRRAAEDIPEGSLAEMIRLQREEVWLKRKLEMLRAVVTDTSAKITITPGALSAEDKMGILMTQIDETEARLKALDVERRVLAGTVMQLIEQLPNHQVRTVMCEKFILRRSLTTISEQMMLSYSYVYRLYLRGIRAVVELECSQTAPRRADRSRTHRNEIA